MQKQPSAVASQLNVGQVDACEQHSVATPLDGRLGLWLWCRLGWLGLWCRCWAVKLGWSSCAVGDWRWRAVCVHWASWPCAHTWYLALDLVACLRDGWPLHVRGDGIGRCAVAVDLGWPVALGRGRKGRRVRVRAVLEHAQTVLAVFARVEVVVLFC